MLGRRDWRHLDQKIVNMHIKFIKEQGRSFRRGARCGKHKRSETEVEKEPGDDIR